MSLSEVTRRVSDRPGNLTCAESEAGQLASGRRATVWLRRWPRRKALGFYWNE